MGHQMSERWKARLKSEKLKGRSMEPLWGPLIVERIRMCRTPSLPGSARPNGIHNSQTIRKHQSHRNYLRCLHRDTSKSHHQLHTIQNTPLSLGFGNRVRLSDLQGLGIETSELAGILVSGILKGQQLMVLGKAVSMGVLLRLMHNNERN